ncbi:hypothetical protein E5161_01975 [Cohnella pontilimi]|uniref:Uncharacterized protein n=1 Tax=Cohnella pontilimi TaxID=2564100 RepID=A0A4U0FGV9_9BACL|nr:hypothetical protein [Cohnella pontilimi]TJY44185.1 hypothetical protein E5161_01975 [Cohnella pontilimi]
MPYTLKHSQTGTLLAGFQVNGYELAYYGIYLWDSEPGAEQISAALSQAGIDAEDAAFQPEQWESFELSEHEAKMANVKLRNDAGRIVYYREGALHAVSLG